MWELHCRRVGFVTASLLASICLAACGAGGSQGGISSVKPSTAQLGAMSSYFLGHYAKDFFSTTSHTGCRTYSMGTQPESGERVIAYTQVICQQCPEATGSAEVVPAVFVLHGESVISSQADTEPGDPMFADQINRMFPPSLQSAANEQQIPNALWHQASALAGC